MTLTDQKAIKMLQRANLIEVEESVDTYPDNEVEGRSDFQIIADEAGYFYSLYSECGTAHYDDLRESRRILSETNYGKRIPMTRTFDFKYLPSEIQGCKDTVNEYNRLGRFVKRLEKLGYHSRWL